MHTLETKLYFFDAVTREDIFNLSFNFYSKVFTVVANGCLKEYKKHIE